MALVVGSCLGASLGLGLGCAERLADESLGDEEVLPVCMIYPARGRSDGETHFVVDPDGSSGRTCMCMTWGDYKQKVYHDELHERALQECLALAAPYESNDCQEMYESGGWLISVLVARGEAEWLTDGKDIDCEENPGCSLAPRTPSPPGALLVILGLGVAVGRRRRLRARPPG